MVNFCKDPPFPPTRIRPSCKELLHWYFLFPLRSRKLHDLAAFFSGPSRLIVYIANANCGGMGLFWPIFPSLTKRFIFAVFVVPGLCCSRCGAVHRMRPRGYFPRFRSSINEILSSIKQRSHKKRWRPDLPRGRQHHWRRSLWGMIRLMLGMSFSGSGLEGFWQLFRLHSDRCAFK